MKVKDIWPGDIVLSPLGEGICIAKTDHMVYPGLMLVIWVLFDKKGSVYFDALSNEQEIGEYVYSDLTKLKDILSRRYGRI